MAAKTARLQAVGGDACWGDDENVGSVREDGAAVLFSGRLSEISSMISKGAFFPQASGLPQGSPFSGFAGVYGNAVAVSNFALVAR